MRMLIAILFPPLHFFLAGRPVAGVIHLILWCISIPLFFVFGLGIMIWFIQAFLAMWDMRRLLQEEQATAIAEKMAEKLAANGAL
jgi:TM2 domain-containing membrane protein YozV